MKVCAFPGTPPLPTPPVAPLVSGSYIVNVTESPLLPAAPGVPPAAGVRGRRGGGWVWLAMGVTSPTVVDGEDDEYADGVGVEPTAAEAWPWKSRRLGWCCRRASGDGV